MKVHMFPGVGLSPNADIDPFVVKNVRIIGDLNAVAARIHRVVAGKLITKPFKQVVAEPFPFEAGLGYFVKVTLDGGTEGFFFCLTGNYRREWLSELTLRCYDASVRIMCTASPIKMEHLYADAVKKALDLT